MTRIRVASTRTMEMRTTALRSLRTVRGISRLFSRGRGWSSPSPDLPQHQNPYRQSTLRRATLSANVRFRKYDPPVGATALSVSTTFKDSPFEYDKLASNPNLQLWAIRIPSDVTSPFPLSPTHVKDPGANDCQLKPSYLSRLQVSPEDPPSGALKAKSNSYTLHSIGSGSEPRTRSRTRSPAARGAVDSLAIDVGEGESGMRGEGGGEMAVGMRLYVPRLERGGKLYPCEWTAGLGLLMSSHLLFSLHS